MVEEIHPNVYDITLDDSGGRRSRVFLLADDVPTLVDTGFEEHADALFDGVDEVGLEPERLVITHGDPDHVDGFEAVVDQYDLESWAPAETDAEGVSPDHRFENGDVIGSIETVHTPGHEPDAYTLVDESSGYLIAGDSLFGGDLRGLPAGTLIPPPALYSANINQAEASMEKLLEYDFETALVFHGSSVIRDAYDRLDAFINFPGKPDWATYQ